MMSDTFLQSHIGNDIAMTVGLSVGHVRIMVALPMAIGLVGCCMTEVMRSIRMDVSLNRAGAALASHYGGKVIEPT